MSIVIDPDLHRRFKLATVAEGKEMSEILIAFIKDYVRKHELIAKPARKKAGRA
jgi:hypothetical protein